MTGPEHYQEAERLLAAADEYGDDGEWATAAARRAAAQGHATLALAAATAMQPSRYAVGRAEFEQWRHAAGVEKRGVGSR